MMLPVMGPDCHLVRTAIPPAPLWDSLGDFHPRVTPFLILFCRKNFKERSYFALGRSLYVVLLSEFPTQGRLRCTQRSRHKGRVAPQCRFTICLVHRSLDHKGSTPVHNSRSPQRQGRVLHAIGGRPTTADAGAPASPPSTHPKLGVSSRHQEFHSCALKRIFRPFLEDGRSD